jgi:hypothetical protein
MTYQPTEHELTVDRENPLGIPKGSLVFVNTDAPFSKEDQTYIDSRPEFQGTVPFHKINRIPNEEFEPILPQLKGKIFSYRWGLMKTTSPAVFH